MCLLDRGVLARASLCLTFPTAAISLGSDLIPTSQHSDYTLTQMKGCQHRTITEKASAFDKTILIRPLRGITCTAVYVPMSQDLKVCVTRIPVPIRPPPTHTDPHPICLPLQHLSVKSDLLFTVLEIASIIKPHLNMLTR